MLVEGRPLKGKELDNLKGFLERSGLRYDDGIEYSVCILNEDYEVIGSGSVDQNVIKCVAIAPDYRGQGILASIITQLIRYEFEKGRTHIFVYTKPKNQPLFEDMGFYTILKTSDILFMENRASGFAQFLRGIQKETTEEAKNPKCLIGAVVANCNPFTWGHHYLLKEALRECDYLHLFLLSEERSVFSAEARYEMVREGIKDLDRIILHRTSDYMISAATFPTYFFKDQIRGEQANCRLDLELFAARIAPEVGITRRFVGTEPYCSVTRAYNEAMKEFLPKYGIDVKEIRRKENEERPISASEVRRFIAEKDYARARELVPEGVWKLIMC